MMTRFLKTTYNDFNQHRYFYLALGLLLLAMSLTLHPGMQGADGRRYLRWTHSFVFDQDLHLLNNFEATGGSYKLTPTGYVFELANIGTPLLWTPFYSAAALFLPASAGPESYPADTLMQLLWLNFSSWLYTILAGILTFAALRQLFTPSVVIAAITAILLGTPVLFYMVTFSLSVHPSIIFLSALLLYLWQHDRSGRSVFYYLALGIVIGWLMLIATYNIVFLLLPGLDLLKAWTKQKNWPQFLKNSLALGLGGLLGFLPQMIVWWFLFGSPFYSPYTGQLLWTEPYIGATLFSTFHGLFFFAPVLLLMIPGLWRLRRSDGWTALSIGLIWLALTYIVSINVAWWAGSSFGNRYFLTLSPFFVWGLAAFIHQNTKWGIPLALLCVLWTAGLYLQFLNGVRLTSDSIIYPAVDIATGQITALANIWQILPRLWVNSAWLSVSVFVLLLLGLILVGLSRVVYGWAMNAPDSPNRGTSKFVIVAVSGALILFIALAGWRGEQTRAVLASQGFYNQPHEVVLREVREVAGKSGLVTRAMYHEHMGQPDQALADLQRAAALWKPDTAATPTRLYLGPKNNVSLPVPANLDLAYPGQVRLVGYQILEANPTFIKGEIFWEKMAGEESDEEVTPIVRAFNEQGNNLGNIRLEWPFPAYYLPAGGLFKDTFSLQLDSQAGSWAWLAVSLAEHPDKLPTNHRGEPQSGVIASINVKTFPSSPLISTENTPAPVGPPTLLLGHTYQPGQTIPLQFLWPASDEAVADTRLKLTLLDSTNKVAAREQYSIQNLKSKIQNATYCFPLPSTLPNGDYQLTFTLQPPVGNSLAGNDALPIRLAAEKVLTATICNLLEAKFTRRYEASAPQNSLAADFGEHIKLLGYDWSIIPQAGPPAARVLLYWRAQAHVTQDYLVSLQLLDAANQSIIAHTSRPANGARPTSTWLNQEIILDEHILEVPALTPGTYRLTLSLLDAQTELPVEVSGQSQLVLQDIPVP
jgi:hypothetical protein